MPPRFSLQWSPTGLARCTSTKIPSYAPGRRSAPAFAKPATAGAGRSVLRRQGFGGLPPPAKSAEASSFNTSRVEAQVTPSSTGKACGLLRWRITALLEVPKSMQVFSNPNWQAYSHWSSSLLAVRITTDREISTRKHLPPVMTDTKNPCGFRSPSEPFCPELLPIKTLRESKLKKQFYPTHTL